MSLEDRRVMHPTCVKLGSIQSWEDYFQSSQERLTKQLSSAYSNEKPKIDRHVLPDLNKRVSVWKGDITKLGIDVIVNAANKTLRGGGGVDGAIHKAAGPKLKEECKTLGGCGTGHAKITAGYELPAKYVVHTVGPVGELPDQLKSCYTACLNLLKEKKLRTVAFPCISTGVYGYPQEAAAHMALKTVRSRMEEDPELVDRVIFCVFLDEDVKHYENLLQLYFPVVQQAL